MPNLRRPFRLKMSAWVDSRQCVNPCVCGCDYLPDDPRISPANLNDGKGNHTSINDFFFNLLYSLVSVWSHFPSSLSFFHTQFQPLLSQYPSFFILYPATVSCLCLSFLTSISPWKTRRLGSHFLHCHDMFFFSVLSHTPRFLFRETRVIILRGKEWKCPSFQTFGW